MAEPERVRPRRRGGWRKTSTARQSVTAGQAVGLISRAASSQSGCRAPASPSRARSPSDPIACRPDRLSRSAGAEKPATGKQPGRRRRLCYVEHSRTRRRRLGDGSPMRAPGDGAVPGARARPGPARAASCWATSRRPRTWCRTRSSASTGGGATCPTRISALDLRPQQRAERLPHGAAHAVPTGPVVLPSRTRSRPRRVRCSARSTARCWPRCAASRPAARGGGAPLLPRYARGRVAEAMKSAGAPSSPPPPGASPPSPGFSRRNHDRRRPAPRHQRALSATMRQVRPLDPAAPEQPGRRRPAARSPAAGRGWLVPLTAAVAVIAVAVTVVAVRDSRGAAPAPPAPAANPAAASRPPLLRPARHAGTPRAA